MPLTQGCSPMGQLEGSELCCLETEWGLLGRN